MDYQSLNYNFRLVGVKGRGAYENFHKEVPLLAKQLWSRANEIQSHLGIEIALFEPKTDIQHLEGNYYVGLMVNDAFNKVPKGMELIELNQQYVTIRGKISNLNSLHIELLKWSKEQGYTRILKSYIVETYHPMEGREEEVRIFLPIEENHR
ncbi:GyrI-like domain-containing protein [Lysinibacillus sp. FSL R7-0073]|uniref:GyrI-like domain-containing protein n=1 Tax=Lysinibacillus TaxID=400634 RepID=UPI002E232C77|nr:GyrI-like domain-containing protein [Lysinibacillus fusiformis]